MMKYITTFTLILLSIFNCFAIPACPDTITIMQPNGKLLTLQLVGDEYYSYSTTLDGYTVVYNEDLKAWEYARAISGGEIVSTHFQASNPDARDMSEISVIATLDKGLRPDVSADVVSKRSILKTMSRNPLLKLHGNGKYDISKFRGLVILVEYEDEPFSRDDYYQIVSDMINKSNYEGYMSNHVLPSMIPCTGSVRDYYYDNSCGKFDPKFDVVGPVKIDYSKYDARKTSNAQALVTAALRAANDSVDYSIYDTDGNRKVDMVYFIFSGHGSNFSGNDTRLIWPHASTVLSFSADGVSFDRYACSTELYGTEATNELDGIGTICHEFSHVLGLPDLYDTDYESSGGQSVHPSKWSVMASGSYLNKSRTPCGYSLYERYALGFASPQTITDAGDYSVEALNKSNGGYRINCAVKNEYFLIENREQSRWDEYLPGKGMLVHRVDSTDVNVWENNNVNDNPTHNYYTLLRANPKTTASGVTDSDGDPFPGSGNVTEITNSTTPGLQSWGKTGTPLIIKNIKQDADGVVSFTVENEDVPTLTETFEQIMPFSGDTTNVNGAFTTWNFVSATIDEITDTELGFGNRAVGTVAKGEFYSGNVNAEVESFSVMVHNASSKSAIVRVAYRTNDNSAWVTLSNLNGTSNPTIPAGQTVTITYSVGSVTDGQFRFQQFSGDKIKKCYFDNIVFNCKTGTLGVTDIYNDKQKTAIYGSNGAIMVQGELPDGTPIEAYSLQGSIMARTAISGGEASMMLAPGFYVVKCGTKVAKVVVR